MSPSRLDEWQDLLDYSYAMLDKANSGEWEELNSMAVDRQSRIETFFAQPVPMEMSDTVASGIHQIGDIDSTITSLANEAKKAVSDDAALQQKRKEANNAYSTTHSL